MYHSVVLALFVGVNTWVVMILRHLLAPQARILPELLHRVPLTSGWVRFVGVVLISIGFALFILALAYAHDARRIGRYLTLPGWDVVRDVEPSAP